LWPEVRFFPGVRKGGGTDTPSPFLKPLKPLRFLVVGGKKSEIPTDFSEKKQLLTLSFFVIVTCREKKLDLVFNGMEGSDLK
jgi:hypothetical protein